MGVTGSSQKPSAGREVKTINCSGWKGWLDRDAAWTDDYTYRARDRQDKTNDVRKIVLLQ